MRGQTGNGRGKGHGAFNLRSTLTSSASSCRPNGSAPTSIPRRTPYSPDLRIRDLAASKLEDKIVGTPALALAVTWGDKGKVDKVTVNKNGADYIGSREGDPTAYSLDSKTFDDLQQSIAGIKPATAPKADTKK